MLPDREEKNKKKIKKTENKKKQNETKQNIEFSQSRRNDIVNNLTLLYVYNDKFN